ncbi:MAG: nucleotidyltransferase domain-containing protein [Gemmatimonadales bacterium]
MSVTAVFLPTDSGRQAEADLLLCCARARLEPARAEHLNTTARRPLDWQWVLHMARLHGVLPLVHRHVSAATGDVVPAPVREHLRQESLGSARRNLRLASQLQSLLRLFSDHGIAALPFKGPTLALAAYGDVALRSFRDLDILVRQQDVTHAGELLASRGFRKTLQLDARREAAFRAAYAEHEFLRADGDRVDLHWAFAERAFHFPLSPEDLWSRRQPLKVAGSLLDTLAPEDLLLVLAAHGTRHHWTRLLWIADVAELVRSVEAIDWDTLYRRAAALGTARMLTLALRLAQDLLDASPPTRMREHLRRDRTVETLAADIRRRLFLGPISAEVGLRTRLFHIRAHERLAHRVTYLSRLVLTLSPRDWDLLPLPRRLYLLYYLVRPLRLMVKYLRRLPVLRW